MTLTLKRLIRWPDNRIFLRVFGIFGGLMLVLMAFYAALIIPQQKDALRKVLYTQASTVSRTIVQACTDAMLTDDMGFIVEHNLQVVANNKSIHAIRVVPARGNMLSISAQGWTTEPAENNVKKIDFEHETLDMIEPSNATSYYLHSAPIRFSSVNWGVIQIDFDISEYNANIHAMYLRMGLISLVAIMVILPIGYLFALWLTRPITAISQAAANIAHGDLDTRVSFKRDDEIGQLSESFNIMVDALRQSRNDLKLSNLDLENKVEQRTAQLLRANHAKDSFLATMSHEIRTPLAGLMGMLELLDLSQLDERQRQMLLAARTSSSSLLRIVNDILDWSKIEAGKLELATEVVSLRTTLQGVFDTYSQLTVGKDIQLGIEIDPALQPLHRYDPLRLAQLLNNFMSNAIKFTERGAVLIKAERLSGDAEHERVRLSVRDTGMGIAPEHLSRLFLQYEQASANTARMYGGTGLGLAICRKLAQLMNGELSVESSVGVGSTFSFTLTLPIAPQQAEQATQVLLEPVRTVLPQPLTAAQRPVQVLLVDDHPINRMLLKQQLQTLGMQTYAACDGEEGIALWRDHTIDIIITDCHMPNMDGYEMTRQIRASERDKDTQRIPIIAWTANVLSEEAERCAQAGMDDMLTKPTELSVLQTTLHKWLHVVGKQ